MAYLVLLLTINIFFLARLVSRGPMSMLTTWQMAFSKANGPTKKGGYANVKMALTAIHQQPATFYRTFQAHEQEQARSHCRPFRL